MGQVDTTLKYGPYNTYQMDANEILYADPFDVALYSELTAQLVHIRTAGSTTAQIGFRWLDSDNKKIGNDVLESISVTNKFSFYSHTISVPANAAKLQWYVKAGAAAFNWGCGKIEPGPFATAFSADLASRTSLLTADGLYTSTISANQIIAGILRSVLGDSGFDLEKPEIWMTSQDQKVKLTISPENPLAVKDKDDNILAGLVKQGGDYDFISSRISGREGGVGQIGAVENGAGFKFDWDGRSFFITVLYNQQGETGFGLYIDGNLRMMFMGDHGFWVFDGNLQNQIYFDEYQGIALGDSDNVTRFYANDNQTTLLSADNKEVVRHSTATGATELISSTNSNHSLGVDNNGPYRIKDGTKTYF